MGDFSAILRAESDLFDHLSFLLGRGKEELVLEKVPAVKKQGEESRLVVKKGLREEKEDSEAVVPAREVLVKKEVDEGFDDEGW